MPGNIAGGAGHYFGNVISGDTGGFNGWGIEDDTSDGGQFHGYSRNLGGPLSTWAVGSAPA